MKHTTNNFKTEVRGMNKEQQQAVLAELKTTLISESARSSRGEKTVNIGYLKKQIAILKTIMKEGGKTDGKSE
jgi:ribosomal protein L29